MVLRGQGAIGLEGEGIAVVDPWKTFVFPTVSGAARTDDLLVF